MSPYGSEIAQQGSVHPELPRDDILRAGRIHEYITDQNMPCLSFSPLTSASAPTTPSPNRHDELFATVDRAFGQDGTKLGTISQPSTSATGGNQQDDAPARATLVPAETEDRGNAISNGAVSQHRNGCCAPIKLWLITMLRG